VTFVDDGRVAQKLIRENITKLKRSTDCTLIGRDATKLGPNIGEPAQLIFLDPPYGKAMGQKALEAAMNGGWIADDAIIVWEENAPQVTPAGFALLDQRRYGDTYISILERQL
jgi:16S rRNA (guanine966-N2)-methyltransferase